jgi:DNA-binding LytR/AlgR family response regulator
LIGEKDFELLNRELFFRPHRSYLINLNYLSKDLRGEGTIILDGDKIVSISRDKKIFFEERLKALKIVHS